MPLPFKRADRVSGLIQEELSRVLFTVSARPGGVEEVLTGLRSAVGFLRGHLGRALRLRYAPELTFEADTSVERSLHVAALLKQVARREDEQEGE